MAYSDISKGHNYPLYMYVSYIFGNYLECIKRIDSELPPAEKICIDPFFIQTFKKGVEFVSAGVAMAYKLPQWKQELTTLNAQGVESIEEVQRKTTIDIPLPKKLKWTGTPAQFGFIINELIGKGYLDRPTLSYSKDSEFYLSIFDINTTKGNLANEVNENRNSFSGNNANRFTIPHKDKLR